MEIVLNTSDSLMRKNKQMQEITRFEADELVFNHDIVDQNFYQDKKAMRFDFTLSNDQFLIVIYDHGTKEKSYFVMAYKNIEEQTITQFERRDHANHELFVTGQSKMCNILPT